MATMLAPIIGGIADSNTVTRMADPSPANMLAAKFSVPYAVAAAVVKGATDVSAFMDAVRQNAAVGVAPAIDA